MMNLDVLNNDNSKLWYADGLKFSCTQSGNCCTGGPGYVWISEEEIGRLAEHLKLTGQQVIERYCRPEGSGYSLREYRNAQGNYDCVFLKEVPAEPAAGSEQVAHSHRTCTIYPVRPLQCRTWPFWEGTLSDKAAWDRAAHRCPGMNQGRHYTAEEIEALRNAKDWPGRG
jgi:Fe-S-cluster containining protein